MSKLEALLEQSAALHNHLCPRQVLGVRMGIWAGELLKLELPLRKKQKKKPLNVPSLHFKIKYNLAIRGIFELIYFFKN